MKMTSGAAHRSFALLAWTPWIAVSANRRSNAALKISSTGFAATRIGAARNGEGVIGHEFSPFKFDVDVIGEQKLVTVWFSLDWDSHNKCKDVAKITHFQTRKIHPQVLMGWIKGNVFGTGSRKR
jgi:hypothetical protein